MANPTIKSNSSDLRTGWRTMGAMWDFNIDAGANTRWLLNCYFPANFIIGAYFMKIITPLAGGLTSTVALGATGLSNTFFFNTANISTLAGILVFQGVPDNTLGAIPATGSQLVFNTGGDALTAGKIAFTFYGFEMDL
jgi:hypothetical protein